MQTNFGDQIGTILNDVENFILNPANIASITGGVLAVGAGIATAISGIIIVIVLSLYFLASLNTIKASFVRLTPARARAKVTEMTEQITALTDPRERLIEGILASLRNVRESPALTSWFATTQRPIGAEMAENSEVIKALTEAFVISLGSDGDNPAVVAHRARWLVRVMTSLMLFPGHDDADERAMLEEFVVPIMLPSRQALP